MRFANWFSRYPEIMSNYSRLTVNPCTGRLENAEWLDNYYGRHNYGVRFPDGVIHDERHFEWKFEEAVLVKEDEATDKS